MTADAPHRQAFLDELMSGNAAHWSLCDGVTFAHAPISEKPGLALQIKPHALRHGQVRQVLERRFEHAQAFMGLFIYLDIDQALVIWQRLHAPHDARVLDKHISAALSLANLERLDEDRSRY
ncbi:transcriptional regulator [Pseudomonas mucidolens]|uniref:transcriptional regulator n=1 Tax=Pseudomonas mucidolens TaxID=46679 RepID=UPI001E626A37|nr:transcriptional regulator [Pseudomonas mucidolens]